MDEKFKNTLIVFGILFVFMIISPVFFQSGEKKKQGPPVKTSPKNETTQPDSTLQNPSQQPDANQPVTVTTISGTDSVPTSNYANPQLNYFYYIPQSVLQNKQQRYPYLILVPKLGGQGQEFTSQAFKDFAEQQGFVIIAPSFIFDEKNFDRKTSYQYPAAWSGQALNDILNSFDEKQGLKPSRLYMLGFSAGAQFVLRYSLLYPDYVTACAVNAAGEADNPTKYQATKFYIAVGSKDIADRKQTAQNFYKAAQQQKIDATYKEYPNIAHQISDDEIKDELNFFNQINSITQGK